MNREFDLGKLGVLGGVVAVGALAPGQATAATFEVTNLDDTGAGSLRSAIESANASVGVADEIVFQSGLSGKIDLVGGLPVTYSPLTITGPGSDRITLDALQTSRVLQLGIGIGESASVSGLTFTGGAGLASGGGIHVGGDIGSSLELDDVVITGNASTNRGGGLTIIGEPEVMITGSSISGNEVTSGDAGGVYIGGTSDVTLIDSSVAGNAATGNAGGVGNIIGPTLTLIRSTVSGNSAGSGGGGVWSYAADLNVTNSTVSGNTSSTEGFNSVPDGGGISLTGGSGDAVINASTITDNTSLHPGDEGGGIAQVSGVNLSIANSIVAGNEAPTAPDLRIEDATVPVTNSVIGELGATVPTTDTGSLFGVDPLLGPLAANGGPTLTHAFTSLASPAIDLAAPGTSPAIDQRGVVRPAGPAPDAGAFENDDFSVAGAKLKGKKKQKFRRKVFARFLGKAKEPAEVTISGKFVVGKGEKKKTYKGKSITRQVDAGKPKTLKLKASGKKDQKKLDRALKKKLPIKAKGKAVFVDDLGNVAKAKRKATIVKK